MNGTFAKSENEQGIQRWSSGCHIGIGFEQTELSDHLHWKVPGIRVDLVQTNCFPEYATGNRYLPTGARSHSKLLRYCSVWQIQAVSLCTPRSDDLTDVLYWSRNTPLWTPEARKRQAMRCTQNHTLPRDFFRNSRRPLWLILYQQDIFTVVCICGYFPIWRRGGLSLCISRTDNTLLVSTCGLILNSRKPRKH